jgi:hypothetical protein
MNEDLIGREAMGRHMRLTEALIDMGRSLMSRDSMLRIGVALFAFGCGLLTDGNVGRIIKDGSVVQSAEAGSGLPGISSHAGGGWNGAAASIHDMGTMNAEARARGTLAMERAWR